MFLLSSPSYLPLFFGLTDKMTRLTSTDSPNLTMHDMGIMSRCCNVFTLMSVINRLCMALFPSTANLFHVFSSYALSKSLSDPTLVGHLARFI